jgi:hypothetical protein
MPPRVKLDDVIEALDTAGEDHSHYLDKRPGEIVLITNEEMEAAEEDELISEYKKWQRESILKAREIFESEDFVGLPDQSRRLNLLATSGAYSNARWEPASPRFLI